MNQLYNVFIVFTDGSTYRSTQPMYRSDWCDTCLEIYFEGSSEVFPWRNIQRVDFQAVMLN